MRYCPPDESIRAVRAGSSFLQCFHCLSFDDMAERGQCTAARANSGQKISTLMSHGLWRKCIAGHRDGCSMGTLKSDRQAPCALECIIYQYKSISCAVKLVPSFMDYYLPAIPNNTTKHTHTHNIKTNTKSYNLAVRDFFVSPRNISCHLCPLSVVSGCMVMFSESNSILFICLHVLLVAVC